MAWHKEVMKQKYNDPDRLKCYLDTVYGPGNWRVEVGDATVVDFRYRTDKNLYIQIKSNNRWMISLTRPWQEVSNLNAVILLTLRGAALRG